MVETNNYYTLREFAEKAGCTKEAVRSAFGKSIKGQYKLDSIWLVPKNQLENFKENMRNYPREKKIKSKKK